MVTGNANFLWAERLIGSLIEQGIRTFFVSPGSRSTPLTLAVSTFQKVTKIVVVDERSAAFAALGQSQSSRIPAALICTSGTAVANYLPAIVEAWATHSPLLVLTANRPDYLIQTGASQTILQDRIFSHYATFIKAHAPSTEKSAENRLSLLAKQAISALVQTNRPVQIDVPFDKPLEPDETCFQERVLANASTLPGEFPINDIFAFPDLNLPETLLNPKFSKPLIIAGPQPNPNEFSPFSESFNHIPMLAEVTSQLSSGTNAIRGFDAFLRGNFPSELRPDIIFRIGKSPVSTVLQRLLENLRGIPVVTLQTNSELDDAALNDVFPVDIETFLALLDAVNCDSNWMGEWRNRETSVLNFLRNNVSTSLTDGFVISTLYKTESVLDWTLHLSNSMPVRDIESFATKGWRGTVFCNRGVAGIDGVLSTAVGASLENNSLAEHKNRNLLIIGDLAALHDIGGMMIARDLNPDLLVLLINNGGGNIFETLPISKNRSVFDTYFLTERSLDWKSICGGFGIPFAGADSIDTFTRALEDSIQKTGIRFLEVKTDRQASLNERKNLWNSLPN